MRGVTLSTIVFVFREKFIRRFGITVAFLATHSGLTRWQDFPQNIDANAKEEP